MPKPIEGVIFSQPWRAWPVKFWILCMTELWMGERGQACGQMARVDSVGAGSGAEGGKRKSDAKRKSPRPLRVRREGRRCSSSVADGRHIAEGGVSKAVVVEVMLEVERDAR